MGVIDLDKRVKKLEQDGAGGAELDQLEAAVTAIENELTVTVTDITDDLETLPEGVTVSVANLQTYGKIRMLTFGALNSGSEVIGDVLYVLPSDVCPYDGLSFISSTSDLWMEEDLENGGYNVFFGVGAGNTISGALIWIANPAPTPGE